MRRSPAPDVVPRRASRGRPRPPSWGALRRRPDVLRPALALRRHPRLWWACVGALALTAGGVVASAVGSAEQARASWAATRTVVVVARDLPAGHRLTGSDLRLEERPVAVVPDGALTELPADGTLAAMAVSGEVLVAARVAPAGLSRLASSLPPGTRAVAVPIEPGLAPPLEVGDAVDLLVTVAAELAGDGPPGFVLARTAPVVAVEDAAVTVAVPPEIAPKVAVALSTGAVTVALTGEPSGAQRTK